MIPIQFVLIDKAQYKRLKEQKKKLEAAFNAQHARLAEMNETNRHLKENLNAKGIEFKKSAKKDELKSQLEAKTAEAEVQFISFSVEIYRNGKIKLAFFSGPKIRLTIN